MTQETKQEQTPGRPEKFALAGKVEHPKGRLGNEAAVTELSNADLQAVNGGGTKIGTTGTGDGNEC